eukprot:scaffold142038_cov49-Tisochrysis_lutea.AAC.1
MPIIKLLRLLDSNASCIGKVYDKMFMIGERLKAMEPKVPWCKSLRLIHEQRWEYLHSPMHSAAYALDPEFMDVVTYNSMDTATSEGLEKVFD